MIKEYLRELRTGFAHLFAETWRAFQRSIIQKPLNLPIPDAPDYVRASLAEQATQDAVARDAQPLYTVREVLVGYGEYSWRAVTRSAPPRLFDTASAALNHVHTAILNDAEQRGYTVVGSHGEFSVAYRDMPIEDFDTETEMLDWLRDRLIPRQPQQAEDPNDYSAGGLVSGLTQLGVGIQDAAAGMGNLRDALQQIAPLLPPVLPRRTHMMTFTDYGTAVDYAAELRGNEDVVPSTIEVRTQEDRVYGELEPARRYNVTWQERVPPQRIRVDRISASQISARAITAPNINGGLRPTPEQIAEMNRLIDATIAEQTLAAQMIDMSQVRPSGPAIAGGRANVQTSTRFPAAGRRAIDLSDTPDTEENTEETNPANPENPKAIPSAKDKGTSKKNSKGTSEKTPKGTSEGISKEDVQHVAKSNYVLKRKVFLEERPSARDARLKKEAQERAARELRIANEREQARRRAREAKAIAKLPEHTHVLHDLFPTPRETAHKNEYGKWTIPDPVNGYAYLLVGPRPSVVTNSSGQERVQLEILPAVVQRNEDVSMTAASRSTPPEFIYSLPAELTLALRERLPGNLASCLGAVLMVRREQFKDQCHKFVNRETLMDVLNNPAYANLHEWKNVAGNTFGVFNVGF